MKHTLILLTLALSACTENADPIERPEYIEQDVPEAVEPRPEYQDKERKE